jgi:hypothetical protein
VMAAVAGNGTSPIELRLELEGSTQTMTTNSTTGARPSHGKPKMRPAPTRLEAGTAVRRSTERCGKVDPCHGTTSRCLPEQQRPSCRAFLMGGTGLEPVTPSLSNKSKRSLTFAQRSERRANPRFPREACRVA